MFGLASNNVWKNQLEIPVTFYCPLTKMIMVEPVLYEGKNYEKEAIERSIKLNKDKPLEINVQHRETIKAFFLRKEFKQQPHLLYQLCEAQLYTSAAWCSKLIKAILYHDYATVVAMMEIDIRFSYKRLTDLDFDNYPFKKQPYSKLVSHHGSYTIYHLACELSSQEIVQHILKDYPQTLNLQRPANWYPEVLNKCLIKAAGTHELQDIQQLINLGANIKCVLKDKEKNTSKTVLIEAIRMANKNSYAADSQLLTQTIQFLISLGSSVSECDQDGWTPLHWAAYGGFVDAVILLCNHGSSITELTLDKRTALHLAAANGKKEVVSKMLELANFSDDFINFPDSSNGKYTALHFAAINGHYSIVKILLKQGADIRKLDKSKNTALHLAAQNNHGQVATILIENGAILEEKNEDEDTPLHVAAKKNHNAMVILLLSKGANPQLVNKAGELPMQLARVNGEKSEAYIAFQDFQQSFENREQNLLVQNQLANAQNARELEEARKEIAALKEQVQFLLAQTQKLTQRVRILEEHNGLVDNNISHNRQRNHTVASSLLSRYSAGTEEDKSVSWKSNRLINKNIIKTSSLSANRSSLSFIGANRISRSAPLLPDDDSNAIMQTDTKAMKDSVSTQNKRK